MKRYIHFCSKCSYFKVVESDNIDNTVKCIKCGRQMHPMKITEEQWKNKSKEEQIDTVNRIKFEHNSNNQVSQNNITPQRGLENNRNISNQDSMQDIINHLAKIRRNLDTIKNILLFFFIMFFIGFAITYFPVIFA